MIGNNTLFDSNVIIYLSKGLIKLEDLTIRYDNIYLSIITYIETLGHNFSNQEEKRLVKNFLKTFEILPLTYEIADRVVKYRRNSRIKVPDAIILATASVTNSTLITNNDKDFVDIDPKVQIATVNPFF